jgi:hypothetical protein
VISLAVFGAAVPEAAIDKDSNLGGPEDNVNPTPSAGDDLAIQAETQSALVKLAA